MGILANIKHLAPFFLYVASILFILKAITGEGRWTFLLLIFLIPLRNVIDRIHTFPLGAQIINILVVVILISLVIHFITGKIRTFAPSTLNSIIFVLVIYTFISLLIGGNYLYGSFHIDFSEDRAKDWKNFCLMPLLFLITLNYMTEKKWIYRVLIVMVFAMIVMGFYTLIQINEFSLVSRDKITGTFQFLGTNEVAAFFNEFTIVLVSISFFIKEKKIKWSLFTMICINIFCILCLYSRGAYLGLFAGMFFLCSFKNRKLLIPLILIAVFWQFILPQKVVERIKETTNEYGQLDNSSQTRIDIWEQSLEIFEKSPLTGIGFGVFRTLGIKGLGDTHNIYVKYLVEQGLIGLIIFLIVLFCFLRMGYVLYKKGEDGLSKGMGLGLMACIVVLMVNNFFGDRWSYLEVSAYLWVFAGLVARLIIMSQYLEPLSELEQKIKTTAVPLQKSKKKLRYYDL